MSDKLKTITKAEAKIIILSVAKKRLDEDFPKILENLRRDGNIATEAILFLEEAKQDLSENFANQIKFYEKLK